MIQKTSLQAYDSILSKLGTKQKIVYDKMIEIGRPVTLNQLAEYLGWPINRLTGRVRELVQLKVVEESCKVKNEWKREVIAWEPIKNRQLMMW